MSPVTISSNNSSETYLATTGDIITLLITSNEPLVAAPSVTIAGVIADVTGGGTSFSATITVPFNAPTGFATFLISDYEDAIGNAGLDVTATTDFNRVHIETTSPTFVSISRFDPVTETTDADALVFVVTFDKPMLAVDAADFDVNGTSATISSVVDVNRGRGFEITVNGGDLAGLNGTVGLNLAAGQNITDYVGNALPAGEPTTDDTYTVQNDTTAPTLVSFERQTPSTEITDADTLVFRATFSEDVINVDALEFEVNGNTTATVTGVVAVSGSVYDLTVSGGDLAELDATVGLDFYVADVDVIAPAFIEVQSTAAGAGDIMDASGNALIYAEPATDQTYTVQNDTTAPTLVSFERQTPSTETTDADTLVFRATFSEFVINVDTTDFEVNGTTTATVTSVSADTGSVFDITVSGGDLAEYNGTVGVDMYTNVPAVAPDSSTVYSIIIITGEIRDAAGNILDYIEPATDQTYTVQNDSTAPTVEILGAPESLSGVTPFDATIEFSEDVLNFVSTDITVSGGSVTSFTPVDGNTYTATITPSGAGDVTIDVLAAVAKDAAGNDNDAATTVTVGNTIVEDTQKVIASFMLNRANNILSNQPSMIDYLNGTNNEGGGPLGFLGINGNEGGMDFAFSTSLSKLDREQAKSLAALSAGRVKAAHLDEAAYFTSLASLMPAQSTDAEPTAVNAADQTYAADLGDGAEDMGSYTTMPFRRYDIWTEIHGATSTAGDAESSMWVGHLGAHYFLSPDLIVGGMMQFDWASEKNDATNSEADGHGWMAEPYIAGRFEGSSLSYEAKALWGRSNNTVSPLGTYVDDFDTERFMASGKLQGTYVIDGLTINPSISIAYWEETQESYTDSLTNTIPDQKITLGEVKFGPSFSKTMQLADGSMFTPTLGIAGVWNFDVANNAASQANSLGDNDLRARVDAGFSFTNTLGWILSANGYYDGIGLDDYEAMGGKVRVTIPVQ